MSRILAIDYGLKRVGIAVTDPLQMIANPHATVNQPEIIPYLKKYFEQEDVECIVVGMPVDFEQKASNITNHVEAFVTKLRENFPDKKVITHDESYTSRMALEAMIQGGTSKKYRREKSNIDKISAVIILQSYLGK